MKNKKITYLLGLAVIVVWGMIIYKIFSITGNNDDNSATISSKVTKEPYNDYEIKQDTDSLMLNYRDPFGLVKQKDTLKLTKTVNKKNLIRPVNTSMQWDFIRYGGYIRNPITKKLLAIVIINGKNSNMAEGETIDHVKLLKNLRDSIKVSFNGKTKFIVLHNGTI